MIIFLDFDGVLHKVNGKRFEFLDNFEGVIKKYPEVKIVFSTSWREYSSLEKMKLYLKESIRENCIGITPMIKEGIKHTRYYEIQQYMKENQINERWIALDDMSVLFPPGTDNLFLINGSEGLSKINIKKLEKRIKSELNIENEKKNKKVLKC